MTDSRAARRKIIVARLAKEAREPDEQEIVAAFAAEVFDLLDNIAAIRVSIERLASLASVTNAKTARR